MAPEARRSPSEPSSRGTERPRLAGRAAVVTGASRGIGRAIALAFAGEGADVAVTYRERTGEAEATVADIREHGRRALALRADITRPDDVERLVDAAWAELGRIDVWVNNAGADILTADGAALSDREKLDRVLAVDVRGTALCCWAVAPRLQGPGGVILNICWDHATTGLAGRDAEIYGAAKAGVLGFSKSLARTLAPAVRVNVLAPGWITTAFAQGLGEDARRGIAQGVPLQRWGTPADVARAAVFLASAEADYLTGVTLPIGGGAVM